MANEELPQEMEQPMEQPKTKNKLMISLIILLVILIASIIGGAWFTINEMKNQNQNQNNHQITQKDKEPEDEYYEDSNEVGYIVQFDQMIINLNSAKGKKNYLKIQINIEFRDDDTQDLYKKRKPLLFDALLTAASNRSKEELMTIGGKEEFKMELKEEFNDIMGQKAIKNIYWKTFVIQ